jgi:hypothetical protein
MGIRGIDIQVAIQRAVDADKIQQGQTGTAKAGEAGLREGTEQERIRNLEQTTKGERSDPMKLKAQKEKEEQESKSREEKGSEEPAEEQAGTSTVSTDIRAPRGHIDLLA